MAWALDSVPADRRGRALSAFGVSVWVGLSLGPQIGHLALDLGGYDAVWISLAGLYVAAFAVAVAMREVHQPRVREKGDPPAERGLRRLLPRGAGRPTLSIAMASYGEGVMSAFLVLHLVGRGVGESAAASVFTVFAVCVLVPRLLGARLIDRFPPRRLSAVALVLDGVGLAILGFSSSFLAAAAGAAVMGFGFAVLYPSLALIATDAAGPERRGAALGAFAAAFSLGLAGGGLISGPVAELTGTGGAFLLAAGSAGLGAVVILGGGAHRPPRPEPVVEPWPAA
jgi:MFS family permease